MKSTQKKELITQIAQLLEQLIEAETTEPASQPIIENDKPLEMLTVKEYAELVNGLSEHTVRQLVAQDKVTYVRAGSGVRGKILVSKASLLKYLGVTD